MGKESAIYSSGAERKGVPRTTKAADKAGLSLKQVKAKKLPAIRDASNPRPPKHSPPPKKA